MGLDPTTYDFQVFRITSEIARQVFPVTLDLDNPAFAAGLDRLFRITQGQAAARRQGGAIGWIKRMGLTAAAGAVFLRLFVLPAHSRDLPRNVRLSPAW